ncbi:probable cytochrome P450 28d2 [Drosophila teissieri]|uniref:probable cytochrome P450 28d2 n=1 Tax=Drosophila teissieri TaxID=7243 RepID=UPI001CBA3FCC|nr:probable cytochrome P450 28d2 [Drosophila teissieri]
MWSLTTFLVAVLTLLALVYLFLTWNFNYWKKRGIQTAPTWPIVGSFPSIFTTRRNIAYDIDDIYEKYKDTERIVGVFSTRVPQLLVLCPEYIHKIYATDFSSFYNNEWGNFVNKKTDMILGNNPFVLRDDEWRERRPEITAPLSPNRVKAVYPVSQSVCKSFVDYIRRQQSMATSEGLDAMDLSLCYTTEVVTDCGLGVSAQSFTDKTTPLLKMIKRVFNTSFGFIFYSVVTNLWQKVREFYSVPFFNKETEAFFLDVIRQCITLRQKTPEKKRDDFLNYMLKLQEKKGLHTDNILVNTMTFLLDGFETTALVLAHIMLMLGRNPEAQQKLRKEIGNADLTFDEMSKLPYLDACIYETLRLFSPQVAARKLVTEPFEFENKNGRTLLLKPGAVVVIPVKAVHHDPQYYEDPLTFKPERFLESNRGGMKSYMNKGVYLAFGDGPRHCPGMRFAMTQLKAAVVEILRNLEIKVNPKTRSDNQIDDTFFMATLKGGIYLDFKDL